MRKVAAAVLVLGMVSLALAGGAREYKQGLVAHYYEDAQYWGGRWPDTQSEPEDPKLDPLEYTFTQYAYSRIEPLINHQFIRNGWFTIRWVGYINIPPGATGEGGGGDPKDPVDVEFELWADDGARLFIDDSALIDDWRACWEKTPESHRKVTVKLAAGYHRIVVEYFQGQSLQKDDTDPAKLYWASDALGIPQQIVPSSHLFHTDEDLETR